MSQTVIDTPDIAADAEVLRSLAQQLRVDSIRAADAAGSGHPTSSMSAAELVAVLFARHLRVDATDPRRADNDHFVLSKGHASPLLYSVLAAAGLVLDGELLTFRRQGSRLEGHPTPAAPLVDVATGSLGQGLAVGVGLALAARLERSPSRVWVLCGDSEMTEGSVWEAVEAAASEGLGNLVAIIDVNRLGQTGPTRHGWDLDAYQRRLAGFGWRTLVVDGHDVVAIDAAYRAAAEPGPPTAVIARTVKGMGASETADQPGKHGQPLDDPDSAIEELGGDRDLAVRLLAPVGPARPRPTPGSGAISLPEWSVGDEVATRTAFGATLASLGDTFADLVVLDGEVANSTRTDDFAAAHPDRFIQAYIAEQLMVAMAVGLQARGWRPVAATFAAFLTRAHDFIRMAAVSGARLCLAGSHAGVSIGEDGPSQMGLEDLAMMRAIHGTTVLYPCDANQAASLTALAAIQDGISYVRTSRGATPVIYSPDEEFVLGGSHILRQSDDDVAAVIAAGITVHEALAAADRLAADGRPVTVVDVYCVEPIDGETVRTVARATGGKLVTVEDHRPSGGLGDAVLDALASSPDPVVVEKLAVRTMPGSATPGQQRAEARIDSDAIVETVIGLTG